MKKNLMPVYQLGKDIVFPRPELADESGILAVGGDLKPERLLLAYEHGIFPWYHEDSAILWWSPDPRMILFPEELKISKSMNRVLRNEKLEITFDRDFAAVMECCKNQPRKNQSGTWITNDMKRAYIRLYQLGYAHSVEVWNNEELAGGLYGVSLGKCFFGESMFSKTSNASKAGFITLVKALQAKGFTLIDCQVYTPHLESLGAREIGRDEFLTLLKKGIKAKTLKGNWGTLLQN